MADLQGQQSKVYRAVETFGNIFALNIIFILCCIPVVTIGASLTALYSVSMKMARNEEGPIWKSFIAAFKSNFKRATFAWIYVILALVVMYGEYVFTMAYEGIIANIYIIILLVEVVAFMLSIAFLFPLIAKFENSLFNTIRNSILLSVSNLWAFFKVMVAWVMPLFLSFNSIGIFYHTFYVWLIFMFALIAFGTSHTINKVFKKVAAVQNNVAVEKEEKKQREIESNKRIKKDGSISRHLYQKKDK